ncbi:GlxA family transcriptional regulator [Pseudoduganella sp. OTU4001]|uniref:GlxA family transcriptional regulator n=1 Tax=Pseudoduganella sp. OTU4001 TaxID=3043854 RepID=UPI00313F2B0F
MRKKVAIIAFDGITPFHLSVPCLVFGGPHGETMFDVTVCSAERGPMRTTAGFDIAAHKSLRALAGADIVIMPTWHDDCRPSPPELLQALRRAHARGATIVGLCLGAFPVAEAGLLDGRTVTTHWAFADQLAARRPQVRVDEEVLYVDEGDVLTSAGAAASLDCSLYLLRKLAGADYANRVARRLLVAPHREGGQAQFIERPVPASATEGRLAQVMEWVQHRLAEEHNLDALAARAAMSRRNFTRHFRQATGTSFTQWLLNQRLTHAQRMLETTDASIEAVAQAAGFGSAISLRQHFRANVHSSPSAYRDKFQCPNS